MQTYFHVDPDDELINRMAVPAADVPDRDVIDELLTEPGYQPATEIGLLAADSEPATDELGADTGAETDAVAAGSTVSLPHDVSRAYPNFGD